ncbi:MAG: T9SS type A sorting domain-containing protein [Dyadobacter sp.]|uniref:T9SS type A sorting domain-containing protein n=1 Tax=Dyadobacter sp. TaxID=1914288 RepID=UPI001B105A15|nr:T9SS type A sorting domain-containing protein [Dyadobacter sp.]MBO9612286.1 T9SS type A sorting domain-containing protein [Dyadobacter sp.]
MKFLLKLVFAGGVISSVAAAPNNDAGSMAMPADSVNLESSIASDLNGSYEIRNPYAESADESFTIAAKTAAPLATRVSCGGRTWTHGEYLGKTGDGQPVYTQITDNRVYLNWNGRVPDNIWILYHLQEGTFPVNSANDALINGCVNPVDPSTAPVNLLGSSGGQITCNGVIMPDGNRLGVFVGSTGNTYQFIKYVNGLLRVMIKQGENDTRTDNYYMGLLVETIQGSGGSYLDPQWRGVLTPEMVNGCFWPTAPKTATPLPDNNCASGPAISNVSNISQTALTVSFTGSGVTSLKWRIKSSGTEVRSGTTNDFGSATSTSISYSSLAPGNYTLEIEGNNCSSAVSSRAFTINEPVVVVPDCQNGPSVTSITSITPSSATINYGGTNLHVFSWRILDGSNFAVGSGKTGTLTSNTANLTFSYLQNGTYTFELKAEDCKAASVVTKSFSISSTDTRTACTRGPSLQSIVSSGETGLQFLFDGDNVFAIDWKVKKDGVLLRQNRVAPTSNTPTIGYNTLATGAYTLEIQGGNCKSPTSTIAFGVNVPLPIYISNFEGKSVEKGVELTWNVVEEKDGKEFEVLRFDDRMQNEEVLGKVALTDQRIGKYSFLDKNPLLGTNYYQLKQIDIDGTYTRSKIVAVKPALISGTVIAPNPAQEYVNVQFSSRTAGTSEVTIYNIAGQPVGSSTIAISEGSNNHRINVKKLGSGHYFMKINHGGEATKLRFIKAE